VNAVVDGKPARVLLDSGNLVGNCVDVKWLRSVVPASRSLTEDSPYQTQPCDVNVRLADGKTVLNVKRRYLLTLMLDFGGQKFPLTAWFLPMPLSQSFILGYETLTTTCYPLFLKVVNHHHEKWIQEHLRKQQTPCPDKQSYLAAAQTDPVLATVPPALLDATFATMAAVVAALSPEDFHAAEAARAEFTSLPLQKGDIRAPWSYDHHAAPEENEIPDPSSFHPDIWTEVPTSQSESRPVPLTVPGQPATYSQLAAMYDLEQPDFCLPGHHPPEDGYSFPGDLMAMSDDYDERMLKYESLIDAQVHDDFPQVTNQLRALLRTDLARDVFVPRDWTGLTHADGTPWVHTIAWKSIPPSRYVKSLSVRPAHLPVAKKEFDHLTNIGYWVKSSSDVVSPMLVAPKATDPFIRLVTNYAWLRPYMAIPQYPIPRVKEELERIKAGDPVTGRPFTCFVDADMCASYHQLLLDAASSELLAVSTPWGNVKPRFLPEGISPASGILMETVTEIFKELKDNSLVLFDNILLMGTSPEDLVEKFTRMLEICKKHNLILKLSKCHLNVSSVSFFGYRVDASGYYLENDRVKKVQEIPFPADVAKTPKAKRTLMQSYLGSANFFNGFVHPSYAERTAPLYRMTAKDFDWNPDTWGDTDYRAIFERHKTMLAENYKLFYPDHSLPWVLRTDASRVGCGGVLYQIRVVDGKEMNEPIAILTRKMSEPAQRWNVMQLEAWAIYWCMSQLRPLLRGKHFLLQTDHRNLQWLEKSTNPTIMRMVANLQHFDFDVEHIPGKINIVADLLSRMYPDETSEVRDSAAIELLSDPDCCLGAMLSDDDPDTADLADLLADISQVHGGRAGHPGVARTWYLLNQRFPDHGLTLRQVQDFIAECITCQKVRVRPGTTVKPLNKTLHSDHFRHIIAIDTMELPISKRGNRYVLVIHNMFTKYTHLVPMPTKDATDSAEAVMAFYAIFGLSDVLHSDQGSDFTSKVHKDLVSWLGLQRTFAPVARPEADGVEPTVREVKRHLQALQVDEDIGDNWDSPANLGLVQLMLNSLPHTLTGVSPLQATFGSLDIGYFDLPASGQPQASTEYVAQLSNRLATLRARSLAYQEARRKKVQDANPVVHTRFEPNSFVFVKLSSMDKDHQLMSRNHGPYEVIAHPLGSNLVQVRNLVTGACTEQHVTRLTQFFGTAEQAQETALNEQRQVRIDRILEFDGDPFKRSTCRFYVRFSDGDCRWKVFDNDLATTLQFERFCTEHRYKPISLLLMRAADVTAMDRRLSALEVPESLVNSKFYLNVRFWNAWYPTQNLPDLFSTNYYVEARFGDYKPRASSGPNTKRIQVICPAYKFGQEPYYVSYFWVQLYATVTEITAGEVLLTPELRRQYGVA
jgi:transposase InsO family protein